MVVRPLSLSASMIRLKPSVSSRSSSAAPAGFSFIAASAMTSSPNSKCSDWRLLARVGAHRRDLRSESDLRLHHRIGLEPASDLGLVGGIEYAHAKRTVRLGPRA